MEKEYEYENSKGEERSGEYKIDVVVAEQVVRDDPTDDRVARTSRQPEEESLMTELWAPIDALIFEGRRVQAAQLIKNQFGHTPHQTIEALGERFEELSRTRPDEFTVPTENYFSGFHT